VKTRLKTGKGWEWSERRGDEWAGRPHVHEPIQTVLPRGEACIADASEADSSKYNHATANRSTGRPAVYRCSGCTVRTVPSVAAYAEPLRTLWCCRSLQFRDDVVPKLKINNSMFCYFAPKASLC